MISAYAHLFHGDGRHSKNPSNFLQSLEDSSANIPGISDSDKCQRFYLKCKADFDAEYWYEELESNSPMVLTSWPTFVKHFRVRWLGASSSSLLEPEPIISKKPDTATLIVRETTTTTATNVNSAITTTTTIPTPTNTAALTIYETTTTTPQQPNRVADVRRIITPPTPFATQVELEAATTSMDPKNPITTAEQKNNEKRAVGREVGKGVEKWDGASEREVERRETDAGEQERTEVRDPAPPPTARLAFDAILHEHTRLDWAAEVDEALGLSPVAHNTSQHVQVDPTPVSPIPPGNPVPNNVIMDPVRTTSANTAHCSPTAIPPTSSPSNDPATPTKPAITPITNDTTPEANNACPITSLTISSKKPDPTPIRPTHTNTLPVNHAPATHIPANPDPSNAAPDTTCPAFTFASTIPNPINLIPIASANSVPTDPVPIDPVPVDPTPVNMVSGTINFPVTTDNCMPINYTCATFANTIPIDPALDDVAPDPICAVFASSTLADVVPVNTSPIITDSTPPVYAPADHTHITFANPGPTHSICANHNPVAHNDTICITAAEPVHIDPVSVTSTYSNLSFTFISLSGVKLICRAVKNHLYSIGLTCVGVFAVFLDGERFWIANEDVHMFGGGTCDSEPWLTAPRAVQYSGS